MAKRKHHTKKRHHRRRSVSGFNAGNLVSSIGGVAVGAAVAGLITSKVLGKQSATVQAIAAIGGGILLPTFIKSDLGRSAGHGMIAVGVISLLKKSGMVSGLGAADEISVPVSVSGADELSVIAGDFAMAGDDDGLSGADDLSVIAGDYAMAGDDE